MEQHQTLYQSNRAEIKKFVDAKAPLNMLKFKMKIKAEKVESYMTFHDELENVMKEQNKFLETVEYSVAVADAMDPVQAATPWGSSWGEKFMGGKAYGEKFMGEKFIYRYTYVSCGLHICTYTHVSYMHMCLLYTYIYIYIYM